MKLNLTVWFFALLALQLSCKPKEINPNSVIEIIEQFSELQTIIDAEKHKLLVVNFWATSCPPCIKEMTHFNRLESEYSDTDFRILLVSLDRAKDLESRVYPFVKKHNIVPEVVILEDQNYSNWTEKIDTSWYGALPATILLKGDRKKFRFGMYKTYEDLKTDINEVLQP